MQHTTDVSLELSALWRRVALLEEDNRQKAAQITDLTGRLEQVEQRLLAGVVTQSRGFDATTARTPAVTDDHPTPSIPSGPLISQPPSNTTMESKPAGVRQRSQIEHFDLTSDDPYPVRKHSAARALAPVHIPLMKVDDPVRVREAVASMNVDAAAHNDSAPMEPVDSTQSELIRDLSLQPILNSLPEFLVSRLYRHQQIGAAFLSSVLYQNVGTIFADALGLGKTLQVLSALYLFWIADYHKIATPKILILTPLTVVPHWANEIVRFNSWLQADMKRFPDPFLISSSMSPSFRTDVLERWVGTGGLLVVSYAMFLELSSRKRDSRLLRMQPGPDVLILDEGHRLCNDKSAIHSSLTCVRTVRRIVVSGYPLQNNLRELYSLMYFVNKPKCTALFKSRSNFRYLYEKVIVGLRASKPDISKKRAFVLSEIIRKNRLFFRRDNHFLKSSLPRKTEIVLTIRFSNLQQSLWASCVQNRAGSFDGIVLHNVATMISDHPQVARRQIDIETGNPFRELLSCLDPGQIDLEDSGKMVLLIALLQLCRAAGEKVVVFSRWIKALSFIEDLIEAYNERTAEKISVFRLDGSTASTERESLIEDFNSSSSDADCFLISTLCGEGISLVSASRVVVLEPSWNPSVDFQAAYRVYRIGQGRPVFIYRLLMGDLFEDKVFQRQLEKIETSSWVMDANNQEVANRVSTDWSEFVKAPPTLDQIAGPTQVSLSDFALNDPITCSLVDRFSLKSPNSFAASPSCWIVSAIEHSKYFDEHAEVRQVSDNMDSDLAFEELEYDRVYTHGTPARDSTLIDNVKRLTSVSVASPPLVAHEIDYFEPEASGDLVELSTATCQDPLLDNIPESCLKPLNCDADRGSRKEISSVSDPLDAERNSSAPNLVPPPSEDGSWHAAVSLPAPDKRVSGSVRAVVDLEQQQLQVQDEPPPPPKTSSAQKGDSAVPAVECVKTSSDNKISDVHTLVSKAQPSAGKRRFEPVKDVERNQKARRPNNTPRGISRWDREPSPAVGREQQRDRELARNVRPSSNRGPPSSDHGQVVPGRVPFDPRKKPNPDRSLPNAHPNPHRPFVDRMLARH